MFERAVFRVRVFSTAMAAVAAALVAVAVSADFPRPAPVPFRWELEFDSGPLRLYLDPQGSGAYWYLTYTVTNRTGSDQLWAPKFTMFTDAGDILDSGRNVPSRITEAIMQILDNDFLQDQNDVIGDILQGRENAKEGLVIWPAVSLSVTELSVFIAGISGETARVKHPINGQEIILRKTLQRDYLVPGSALARGSQPVELVSQQWVLR